MSGLVIPGNWANEGFKVRVTPAPWVNDPDQRALEYIPEIQRLNFTKEADGGDWEMTIAFSLPRTDIEKLYTIAVGRIVEVFDEKGLLFTGIINRANANLGTFVGNIGKLLNVDNKVKAVYSSLDTTDSTNIIGIREETDWFEDSDSQELYGIQERVMSVGGSNEDEIDGIVQSWLSDSKFPETNETINIGQAGTLSIEFEIIGLSQFFKKYLYTSSSTGTQNASDKIKAVLNADPNSIYSSDQSGITSNTTQVGQKEDQNRTAYQILKGIYSMGDDTNNDRWIFGINENRKAYYNVVPSEIRYEHRISERDQAVYDNGIKVKPWRVKPGYWLKVSDFIVGETTPNNPSNPSELRKDKRNIFIERVNFRFPYSVSIKGGRVERTSQILAQAGLAGIG